MSVASWLYLSAASRLFRAQTLRMHTSEPQPRICGSTRRRSQQQSGCRPSPHCQCGCGWCRRLQQLEPAVARWSAQKHSWQPAEEWRPTQLPASRAGASERRRRRWRRARGARCRCACDYASTRARASISTRDVHARRAMRIGRAARRSVASPRRPTRSARTTSMPASSWHPAILLGTAAALTGSMLGACARTTARSQATPAVIPTHLPRRSDRPLRFSLHHDLLCNAFLYHSDCFPLPSFTVPGTCAHYPPC